MDMQQKVSSCPDLEITGWDNEPVPRPTTSVPPGSLFSAIFSVHSADRFLSHVFLW